MPDPVQDKDISLDEKSFEVLQYIGGRIASKFGSKYPEVAGPPDKKCQWITLKNSGGLGYPSESLMTDLKKMEMEFQMFHGNKIDLKPDPIKRLKDLHKVSSGLPDEIITFFVKIRFFRRIKELNLRQMKPARSHIRNLKQQGQFQN